MADMEIDTLTKINLDADDCGSLCTFTRAKVSSKKSLIYPFPAEREESYEKRRTDLDVCLNFFDSFQKAVESKAIDAFCKEFNEQIECETAAPALNKMIPVFIFASSISSYSSLKLKLSSESNARTVVLIDCFVIDLKVDFFSEMITGIIGERGQEIDTASMSIPYDFSILTKNSTKLNANIPVTVLFENSAKLNLSHLNDFIKLWDRKRSQCLPRLSLIFDDVNVFIGMDRNLRESFQIFKHRQSVFVQSTNIFNDLLVEMIFQNIPLYPNSALISQLSSLTSLSALIARMKFLSIASFSTLKAANATCFNPEMKSLLLFLNQIIREIHTIRPSAPTWSFSHIYGSVLSASGKEEFECLDQFIREIIGELKSMHPNDFIFVLQNAKNDLNPKDQMFLFIQSNLINVMKEAVAVSNNNNKTSNARSRKASTFCTVSNNNNINVLKDTQLNVINELSNYLHGQHANFRNNLNNYSCVFEDLRGILRKAFDADPTVALQTALKHPNFYLNCPEVLVSKKAAVGLSSENLSTALITENNSKLFDTSLLYRLSLEINHKSINLVEWFNSFTSILSTASTPTSTSTKPNQTTDSRLLMARFFKSLNELQLIGMVSEFGKSRKKRRSVDRLNLTDNLDIY